MENPIIENYLGANMQESELSRRSVDISVVFATLNRSAQLRRTLNAYREVDTAGVAWELIVVDNNSTDNTAEVLQEASAALPLVRLFVTSGGQNRARNAALGIIRGDLIMFTDDDAVPDPQCLQAYLSAAHRWPDDAIFGARVEPHFPPGTPAWMKSPAFSFSSTAFARYAPADHEGYVERHPYGPSFAIRRSALGKHRFPEHLGPQEGSYAMGGEGHFLRRIRSDGRAFVYVPSARVEHVIRPDQITPEWLMQRANKKGRGQVYLPSNKRPRRLFWRGVALRLWLAAARAGFKYLFARLFFNPALYTQLGIRYQLRRGQIQESLVLRWSTHSRDNSGAPDIVPVKDLE